MSAKKLPIKESLDDEESEEEDDDEGQDLNE